jgi:hypothetical protein
MAAKDSSDRRAAELRRFRNFALFWIMILVLYFIGADIVVEQTETDLASVAPALLLLMGCILLAAIWHAAAVVSMSLKGLL